jgi:hypothetical protein
MIVVQLVVYWATDARWSESLTLAIEIQHIQYTYKGLLSNLDSHVQKGGFTLRHHPDPIPCLPMPVAQHFLLQLSCSLRHRDPFLSHPLTKESKRMAVKFSDVAYCNISQSTLVYELPRQLYRDIPPQPFFSQRSH